MQRGLGSFVYSRSNNQTSTDGTTDSNHSNLSGLESTVQLSAGLLGGILIVVVLVAVNFLWVFIISLLLVGRPRRVVGANCGHGCDDGDALL